MSAQTATTVIFGTMIVALLSYLAGRADGILHAERRRKRWEEEDRARR